MANSFGISPGSFGSMILIEEAKVVHYPGSVALSTSWTLGDVVAFATDVFVGGASFVHNDPHQLLHLGWILCSE